MVLTPHLLAGAAIASGVQSPILALVLAFLSHFLLDILPHHEYHPIRKIINKIKEGKWGGSFLLFLKIAADMLIGLLAIFLLSDNTPLIYAGAFFGILADGANFIAIVFPNKLLNYYNAFHLKFHFPEDKKIPVFQGIFSQALVIFVSILYLLQPQILP